MKVVVLGAGISDHTAAFSLIYKIMKIVVKEHSRKVQLEAKFKDYAY